MLRILVYRSNSTKLSELSTLMVKDHHGEPNGAHHRPRGGQHGRPYGAHKSIIPKASTASVFMGAHGPVSLSCCNYGGSWAWSRGEGGNIGLIPHTSRNTSPPICFPLIPIKRVSHHAGTNPLMNVRNDMVQQNTFTCISH